MCGICGFIKRDSSSLADDKDNIKKMLSVLNHRGPDHQDSWVSEDGKVILGHSRLSIIDLSSNGNQPMESENRRYVMSYNGETYNHLKLRDYLKNVRFKSSSDTESILNSFMSFGVEKTLQMMEGMFAIILYDKKENNIYLIRDRFGEKPLYYYLDNKNLIFASEIKSLLKHSGTIKKLNDEVLNDFFNYNYIGNKNSIYKNINKVLPAHYLKINLKSFKFENINYWQPKFNKLLIENENDLIEKVENKLILSVNKTLTSDLPVGCFLSGGVDSSLIASIVRKHFDNKLNTFSIGFENKNYDESEYAKDIASYLNTDHHEYFLKDSEIFDTATSLSDVYDEPFADSSQIPTIILSKLTKKKITVCLTGDGADELFYGYDRYNYALKVYNYLKLVPQYLRKKIFYNKNEKLKLVRYLLYLALKFKGIKNIESKIEKILNLMNFDNFSDVYKFSISNEINSNNILKNNNNNNSIFKSFIKKGNSNLSNMIDFDIKEYLPNDILTKVDRASMFSSLETRAPFLNHDLASLALSIPSNLHFKNGVNKYILKKILSKYIPEKLFKRPKMGFGVPLNDWLKNQLSDWCDDLLSEKKLKETGIFNYNYIVNNYYAFKKNKANIHSSIWSILIFQSWYFKNFK
jgi:asparagine synthase (glutamine-hydrolysing)